MVTGPDGDQFGEDHPQQTQFASQIDGASAMPVLQHLLEFLSDPFVADDQDLGGHFLDGSRGGFVECEFKPRCQPDGAEHPKLVFTEALQRFTNRPQQLELQVPLAPDVVVHLLGDGIVEHPVHGEVPALSIFFRSRERDVFRAATVVVGALRAERGDFDLSRAAPFWPQHHDHPKARPDGQRPPMAKDCLDLFRPSAGRDVVVIGCPSQ